MYTVLYPLFLIVPQRLGLHWRLKGLMETYAHDISVRMMATSTIVQLASGYDQYAPLRCMDIHSLSP